MEKPNCKYCKNKIAEWNIRGICHRIECKCKYNKEIIKKEYEDLAPRNCEYCNNEMPIPQSSIGKSKYRNKLFCNKTCKYHYRNNKRAEEYLSQGLTANGMPYRISKCKKCKKEIKGMQLYCPDCKMFPIIKSRYKTNYNIILDLNSDFLALLVLNSKINNKIKENKNEIKRI